MADIFRITAPCHFGMEAVLKREIYDLGYEIDEVDNGRVTFTGDGEAIARANIGLRTTERVLLNAGQFEAYSFTELFDKTYEIPWDRYIPADASFPVVKATSVNSKLFSTRDIQSIVKKAVAEKLKKSHKVSNLSETGANYPIRVNIIKDRVLIGIDTSGVSLHKRGYRQISGEAPISETLAAAIILLTPWRKGRTLVDPFCGSGTFAIEAAMIAAGIAPGLNREFTSMEWENIVPKKTWYDVFDELRDQVNFESDSDIQAYDIDENVLKKARLAAKEAGVEGMIHFQRRDVKDLSHPKKYGFLITNPPYGERLEDKEKLPAIYSSLGNAFNRLDSWSAYVITPYEGIEKDFGRKATKKRKLYNGMIKTDLYAFEGPRPPKKQRNEQ